MFDFLVFILLVIGITFYIMNFVKAPSGAALEAVKDFVYVLVLQAEKMWGGGTGDAKKAFVVKSFYERAPDIFKRLIKPEKLFQMIEAAVSKMKQYFMANPPAKEKILGGEGDGEN